MHQRMAKDAVTIVTTTSHTPAHPSTDQVTATLQSIRDYPEMKEVPHVIVCDGLPDSTSAEDKHHYHVYTEKLRELASQDTPCSENPWCNTTVLVNDTNKHIAQNIKDALQEVHTPLVAIHQHDFEWKPGIPIGSVLKAMQEDQDVNHVGLCQFEDHGCCNRDKYQHALGSLGLCEPDTYPGIPQMRRLYGYSDNDHITRKDFFANTILPLVGDRHIPMEHAWEPHIRQELERHPPCVWDGTCPEQLKDVTAVPGAYMISTPDRHLYHHDGRCGGVWAHQSVEACLEQSKQKRQKHL